MLLLGLLPCAISAAQGWLGLLTSLLHTTVMLNLFQHPSIRALWTLKYIQGDKVNYILLVSASSGSLRRKNPRMSGWRMKPQLTEAAIMSWTESTWPMR